MSWNQNVSLLASRRTGSVTSVPSERISGRFWCSAYGAKALASARCASRIASARPSGAAGPLKPTAAVTVTAPSEPVHVPFHRRSAKPESTTPFATTKRRVSFSSRCCANTMPLSAALCARETLSELSAVRRLPCATIAIAAASEPKMTRNIIASTLATPRRLVGVGRLRLRLAVMVVPRLFIVVPRPHAKSLQKRLGRAVVRSFINRARSRSRASSRARRTRRAPCTQRPLGCAPCRSSRPRRPGSGCTD